MFIVLVICAGSVSTCETAGRVLLGVWVGMGWLLGWGEKLGRGLVGFEACAP